MPTTDDINKHRVEAFKQKILDGLGADDLEPYAEIIAEILEDDSIDPTDLCAVLAKMANGNEPLTIEKPAEEPEQTDFDEIDSARAGRMEKIEQEKIVDKLRNGQLDILVATDVAARGLDVDRITHVQVPRRGRPQGRSEARADRRRHRERG